MGRFVQVSAGKLLAELREIGALVEQRGGTFHEGVHAHEIVVDLVPAHARAMVRVYTSLAIGAQVVRQSGEDAVRILVCVEHPEGFRKLEESRRVFRTAPAAKTEAERERLFLDRLRGILRLSYALAQRNPPCPLCGRATADRAGKFRGCSGYPLCRGKLPTRELVHATPKRAASAGR